VTRPFVIGVTGGIATGKSSVLRLLTERGVDTIDADAVYHSLIAAGGALVEPIAARFGRDMVADDGSIDRRALAGIVFADRRALADLDAITHPAVLSAVEERIARSPASHVAVDAVKLIESGMAERCDAIWLVVANRTVQKERLMQRNGLTSEEAEIRLAAQPDEAPRRERADIVIENSGDFDALAGQVEAAWRATRGIAPED
jgi:dephospho-CoA kinase